MIPSPESEFIDVLKEYIGTRYKTQPATAGELEALMVGYLAGSRHKSLSMERLAYFLENYAKFDKCGPYRALYDLARRRAVTMEDVLCPPRSQYY